MKNVLACALAIVAAGSGALALEPTRLPKTIVERSGGETIPFSEIYDALEFADNYLADLTNAEYEYDEFPDFEHKSDDFYSSSFFSVTMENIGNYSHIGDYTGVHHVAYIPTRIVEAFTFPTAKTVTKATIIAKLRLFFGIAAVAVEKPENKTVELVKEIQFKRGSRPTVNSVNIFDPEESQEGWARPDNLSDYPAMKRLINVHQRGAEYTSGNCLASAYLIQGKGDDDPYNKIVIVSDGFDPRNRIGIQELIEKIPSSTAPNGSPFIDQITAAGFDVVFVEC
jgi:hypothetical protein